jgi:hypothetical protein
MALAQRLQLDGDGPRPVDLEDRRRRKAIFECEFAVGDVAQEQQIVFVRESHETSVVLERRDCAGGVVWIVQDEDPGGAGQVDGDSGRVQHEVVFQSQIDRHGLCPAESDRSEVGGVARGGDDHSVAGIEDRLQQMEDALLATEDRQHLP